MELRVLKYFQTVVVEKNITRAALQLHVSQPTISRQLQSLESELETSLFERGHKNIQLTSAGEYFYNQVNQILSLADKTIENLQQDTVISGIINIGSAEARSFLLVAQTIRNVQRKYPNINFEITSTNADVAHHNLTSGIFDFGIVLDINIGDDFDFISLPGASRWGILAPINSKIAQQDTVSLQDLLSLKLIISSQTKIKVAINEWFETNIADDLNIVATYNLLYNASLLVAAGVGYALCIDGIVNTNQSQLRFIPLSPNITSTSSLIWVKNRDLSPTAKVFLDQLTHDLSMNNS
ncbi:LysR family transcriptional regulator [Pediococcus claussenii]|uniref:Transcriptional regulator, LysR family n=1 Tax=Pediococcus claussenii (strain ATCC BAA-344 / DSM 14800 / JCM 18046 / KCTC 3811 / LMG 21948 / P06) TaxID=701521 RepID=G8PAW3_PEDCP|nr:LysR family transcriptional regulator [Pediococcus claussenii]AEV95831.1 Transcriptional regulator, LysR family [Pediococcus claussenii ATCC BAA-344]ANZ69328.1 LysR family transcriptional regulator [Pediococcus claussenii]ANZ71148.1 LysR family transcriptional regulator [Pediococcus claussenii]KRN20437.1 hypothetical protein IV79_GL000492 [Pediococcus claussenii]